MWLHEKKQVHVMCYKMAHKEGLWKTHLPEEKNGKHKFILTPNVTCYQLQLVNLLYYHKLLPMYMLILFLGGGRGFKGYKLGKNMI